jgi:hypothetical protein
LDEVTLGERALDLHSQIRRLQAYEAQVLRNFDVRDAAVADGYGSGSMWLAAKDPTTTRGEAGAIVGLGRDLAAVPEMAAAFTEGAISAAHVRQVAKAVKPLPAELAAEGDAFLAPLARRLDARQFAIVVAQWLRAVRPDEADKAEERDWESRAFTLARTLGGMWHGVLNGEPDGGARLDALLAARAAKAGPDDPRTKEQRRYDALMSLVDEAIANAGTPGVAGNVPEIFIHARPETLLDEPGAPPATDSDGTPLTRSAWTRLCCDGRWSRVLLDAITQTIDYGRATRDWPPALRKYIYARDGGCRYPGCTIPARATQIHHCTYWRHGGTTCADNGLLLCRFHHHCVHQRGYTVKLLPDGTAIWTLPGGTTLESQPRGPTVALLL